MSKNFNGYLFSLFAIFFWSFNVIYSKYLANTFTPMEISFVRWTIPSVLCLPFMYRQIWFYRKIFLKHFGVMLVMTLTGLSFQNAFIYYAGHTSSAIDMALIGATSPIFLVIFSAIFLKEKVYFRQVIGIILALVGVLTVILDGHLANFNEVSLTVGDLWMLVASLVFTIYAIVQRKLPKDFPQMPAFVLMICLSSLLLFSFALYDYVSLPIPEVNRLDIGILFVLGVFNSGVAYFAWNKALQMIGTIKTGIMYYIMPIFSTVEAYFLLGERMYENQIYGIFLIVFGVICSNVGIKKTKNKAK